VSFPAADAKAWQRLRKHLEQFASQRDLRTAVEFGVWVENVRLLSILGLEKQMQVPQSLLEKAGRFTAYFGGRNIFPEGVQTHLQTIGALAGSATLTPQDYKALQKSTETLIALTGSGE
jgi:hypothetical protein